MKKQAPKLHICRETLANLDTRTLAVAAGATAGQSICCVSETGGCTFLGCHK
jgi:hypothetical protein